MQEEANNYRSIFVWVSKMSTKEEEVVYSFEYPEGYPWELLLTNEKEEGAGFWIRAEASRDELNSPKQWFRVLNFRITYLLTAEEKDDETAGRDSMFNHITTEQGVPSTAMARILRSQEHLIFKVELNGYPVIGVRPTPFTEDDDNLKKSEVKKYKEQQENRVTAFAGIRNEGATCYLNSLLQTYFMIGAFSRAVFSMETGRLKNLNKSIPNALQRLFFTLQ